MGCGTEAGCTRSGFLPPFADPNVRFGSGIVAAAGASLASSFADFVFEAVATGRGLSAVASLAGDFAALTAGSLGESVAFFVLACAVCVCCAVFSPAYKSITSRDGLFSREAL